MRTTPIPSRRRFLKAAAGTAAMAMPAAGYGRVKGANDRINIGLIGCGSRGKGVHLPSFAKHAKAENVAVTAIADPWRQRREEGAAAARELYGAAPAVYVSHRDLLQQKDLDAVVIASCDFQHTTHLKDSAEAGKDVYVEKPLAMDMEKLKAACDACTSRNVVVQVGTQQRSYPKNVGVREVYKSGILATVSRIEQHRNGARPYWYSRIANRAAPEDVEWQEFLMDRPQRPFDPHLFTGWYGFMEFNDGPVSQWGSHYLDLVHYITGARYPSSCVCLGGTFAWKDEHNFTCPDHVQAQWIYPEGFMVSFMTNFGNSWGNLFRIYGEVGSIDLVGPNDPTAYLTAEGGIRNKGALRGRKPIDDVARPDHWLDWLQCLRSRRECHAPLEAGYRHAVACIMARRAFESGRRMMYDQEKRLVLAG